MIGWLIKLFGGGLLDRVLSTIDKRMDNAAAAEQAKQETVREWARQQATILNGPGRWLTLFFIVPLGFWFSSVCIYSVLWCRDCIWPQGWTIAALPPPLDQWSWAIIASLFVGGFGVEAVMRRRK